MDTEELEHKVDLGQLPDDPLKMPPPYWRSNGAIFHILSALEKISDLLHELIPLHAETNERLADYFDKYPAFEEDNEEALDEFSTITEDLSAHEHKISLQAEIACLMSAIEAEDRINCFCVYNLHKDIAESIEKLSPPEKLLIASRIVSIENLKSNTVFESIRKLSSWRNAFAHGHCVDRLTRSLRHNHLIPPQEYPGVPSLLTETKELVGGYIRLSNYLRKISLNTYTKGESSEIQDAKMLLEQISKFRFEGDNWVYDIVLDEKHQKEIARRISDIIQNDSPEHKAYLEDMLAVVNPFGESILRMEFGLNEDKRYSRAEIMDRLKLSSIELSKERAIALTQMMDLENLIFENKA